MHSRDRTQVGRLARKHFTGPLIELLITIFTLKLNFLPLTKHHFKQVVEIKALNWLTEHLKLSVTWPQIFCFMEPLGALLGNVGFVPHSMKTSDQERADIHSSTSSTLCLKIPPLLSPRNHRMQYGVCQNHATEIWIPRNSTRNTIHLHI